MIISKRRQQQSLRNYLAGHALGVETDWLDDDHYTIYDIITDLRTNHQFDQYRIQAYLTTYAGNNDPALESIVKTMLAMEPRTQPRRYLTLEDIGQNLPDITWFWPGWIPRGFLTTVAAEPGVGKTNIALDLSRRVIHRMAAPDGQTLTLNNGGNVIYIEAENFRSGLYERAKGWGVDMSKLFVFPQDEEEDPDLLDLAATAIQDDLRDMCLDLHPDLIIIDSFSSVQIKSENSIEDVRDILKFFGQLATDYNCAVILLHHLRKPGRDSTYNNVTQHDLRGSSHLAAMSRAIIGMWVTSKSNNGPRRIQIIKSNLAPAPPPLDITYTPHGSYFAMRFEKLTEPDLPENLTGQCAEWLKDVLSKEPLSYSELKELGDEAGFKENTIQNARKALDWKVVDTKGAGRRGNKWAWYSQVSDEPDETDEAGESETDEPGSELPESSESSELSELNGVQLQPVASTNGNHMVTWPCDTGGGSIFEGGGVSHGHVTMRHNIERRPRVVWLPGRRRPYRRRPATIAGPGFNAGYRLRQKRCRPAQARPRPADLTETKNLPIIVKRRCS